MSDFPKNGGRMGQAIRDFGWQNTPLGPIDSWPLALRTVVQMMVMQRQAICIFWGPELRLIYNDAYAPMLGGREPRSLGEPCKDIWVDVWSDIKPFFDRAMAGEGTFDEDMRLVMTRNGYEEETFWTFSYSPVFDDAGAIAGVIDVALDTTAVVQSRRTERVLQRELVHRVKNSLAVTSAVVSATLRSAATLEDARETITRRINALGEAQSLLADGGSTAQVEAVVREAIRPHIDKAERLSISGPAVAISSQQALGLSMALYELATNALKYGALSNDRGNIAISWESDADNAFRFHWQEQGGPVVNVPTQSGFGSRLTNKIVAAYFSGTGETFYESRGLRFVLSGTARTNLDEG